MAKYIDTDRLKAKLDEHYRNYQSKYMEARTPYTQGLIDALDLAEQVIDSLQQEQQETPVPNDLEEAAEEYAFTNWEDNDYHAGASEGVPFDPIGYTGKVFIAGAKWQAEQDLAEMAQSKSPLSVAYANRCFENGKQAMKDQLMKEAVEGEVYLYHSYSRDATAILVDIPKENLGDKVRIIIVKED